MADRSGRAGHGVETAEEAAREHAIADAEKRDAAVRESLRTEKIAAGRQTMLLAVLAGAGFGVYFICLKMANPAGVVWPMATARMGSLTICGLMLLGGVCGVGPQRGCGGADYARGSRMGAGHRAARYFGENLMFVAATRAGRLDIASVLASLYPASTILLAALTLGESGPQPKAGGRNGCRGCGGSDDRAVAATTW